VCPSALPNSPYQTSSDRSPQVSAVSECHVNPHVNIGYSWPAGKSQFKLDFVVSLDQWQNLSEVPREALVRT
jgi:hypothetical protein